MLRCEEVERVFVFTQACDMRMGFDKLAALVAELSGVSVLRGGVFVFFDRRHRRVKLLWWDRDGYAVFYKRLEAGVFRIEEREGHEELTGVDLKLLLEGTELSRLRFRKKISERVYG